MIKRIYVIYNSKTGQVGCVNYISREIAEQVIKDTPILETYDSIQEITMDIDVKIPRYQYIYFNTYLGRYVTTEAKYYDDQEVKNALISVGYKKGTLKRIEESAE